MASVPPRPRHAALALGDAAPGSRAPRARRARDPHGWVACESREDDEIGRRIFDDLYELGRDRTLSFSGDDGRSITMQGDAGYPYAQVLVPTGKPFAALEPMTAPTNALVDGTAPVVAPGESFTARFTLTLT